MEAFERAAVEAARRYRFKPARDGDRAVAAWVNWPVHVR
jgi:hypothetical protein